MKLNAAHLQAVANTTGFPPDNLEKVLRLRELLTEFHKHLALRDRLVLKGGTAINLFCLDLVRLSVDIDLNYIAHVERQKMLAERPDVVRAVEFGHIRRSSGKRTMSPAIGRNQKSPDPRVSQCKRPYEVALRVEVR